MTGIIKAIEYARCTLPVEIYPTVNYPITAAAYSTISILYLWSNQKALHNLLWYVHINEFVQKIISFTKALTLHSLEMFMKNWIWFEYTKLNIYSETRTIKRSF